MEKAIAAFAGEQAGFESLGKRVTRLLGINHRQVCFDFDRIPCLPRVSSLREANIRARNNFLLILTPRCFEKELLLSQILSLVSIPIKFPEFLSRFGTIPRCNVENRGRQLNWIR